MQFPSHPGHSYAQYQHLRFPRICPRAGPSQAPGSLLIETAVPYAILQGMPAISPLPPPGSREGLPSRAAGGLVGLGHRVITVTVLHRILYLVVLSNEHYGAAAQQLGL